MTLKDDVGDTNELYSLLHEAGSLHSRVSGALQNGAADRKLLSDKNGEQGETKRK